MENQTRPNRFHCPYGCGGLYAYTEKTEVMKSGIKRIRRCTKCKELYETFEKSMKKNSDTASDDDSTKKDK